MARSLRGCAALLLVPAALLLACTRSDPAPAGDAGAAGAAAAAAAAAATEAPAPAAAAPTAPAAPAPGEALPGTEALPPASPSVQVAVDVANDLFLGRYDAVNARFEAPLRDQLTPATLRDIVAGVVAAHGDPDRLVDAWAGEVREEGVAWPTASVLLRMSRSPARFRLLLVFNRDGCCAGLWLRPL